MEPEILAVFGIEGASVYDKIKPTKNGVKIPLIDRAYKYGAIVKGVFNGDPNSIAVAASKNGITYRLVLSVIFEKKPYGMNNLAELVKVLEGWRKIYENNG